MNVSYCSAVKNPGDWAFFNEEITGTPYVKACLPIAPVQVPYETVGDLRIAMLPLGQGGWAWDGNADCPTITPSIKTEVVVGHTQEAPPKPIMREIWHGHLTQGKWVPDPQHAATTIA